MFGKPSAQRKKELIAGRHPVLEALQAEVQLSVIYVQNTLYASERMAAVLHLAREKGVPVKRVPVQKMAQWTSVLHQGVVAFTSPVRFYDLQDIIDFSIHQGRAPFFLLLDGITDVRNIGAIVRSAYALAATAVILPGYGVAPLRADSVKTSAGALLKIKIARVSSTQKAVDLLLLNGVQVLLAAPQAEKKLCDMDLTAPAAVVMGGEDKGAEHLHAPDLLSFSIPMPGGFDSLNVAAASAIVLYEMGRQRGGVVKI